MERFLRRAPPETKPKIGSPKIWRGFPLWVNNFSESDVLKPSHELPEYRFPVMRKWPFRTRH